MPASVGLAMACSVAARVCWTANDVFSRWERAFWHSTGLLDGLYDRIVGIERVEERRVAPAARETDRRNMAVGAIGSVGRFEARARVNSEERKGLTSQRNLQMEGSLRRGIRYEEI